MKSYVFLTIFLFLSCQSGVKREVRDGVLYIKNPKYGRLQNKKEPPVKFVLEQTFGVEEEPMEETLVHIRYVVCDNQENVYILDGRDHRLVSFKPDGTFRWSVGREGGGPGEFARPRGMAFDGKELIYISNISGTRIDQFNLKGEFLQTYLLTKIQRNNLHLEGYLEPDILVLSDSRPKKIDVEVILIRIGKKLELVDTFRIDETDDIILPGSIGLAIDVKVANNEISIGNSHRYRLRSYDHKGNLKKVILRDVDGITKPGSYENRFRQFSEIDAPLLSPGKYQIVPAWWPTNVSNPNKYLQMSRAGSAPKLKYFNTLDIFDHEGVLLYSIEKEGSTTPDIGELLCVDAEGRLYTSKLRPYPHVCRYRVEVKQ